MGRELARFGVAALVTVATALLFVSVRLPDAEADGAVEMALPGGAVVEVSVEDPGGVHLVELRYGGRRSAVTLSPATPRQVVAVPHLAADHVLVARVDPPAPLRVLSVPAGSPRSTAWAPVAITVELPPPTPAGDGDPLATAAVDGSDVWGVRPNGIPLRAAPRVDSDKVATVYHGDVLQADCWVLGQSIGNGYAEARADTYRSPVWYRVQAWDGRVAFIPDTRFSRTASTSRLNLPACGAT
jgi:hypothetical protein